MPWRFSFVQLIHLKPLLDDPGSTYVSDGANAVSQLQKQIATISPTFKLFVSVQHVAIDVSAYGDFTTEAPLNKILPCLEDTISTASLCMTTTDDFRVHT